MSCWKSIGMRQRRMLTMSLTFTSMVVSVGTTSPGTRPTCHNGIVVSVLIIVIITTTSTPPSSFHPPPESYPRARTPCILQTNV
jgi:hypothetical protein